MQQILEVTEWLLETIDLLNSYTNVRTLNSVHCTVYMMYYVDSTQVALACRLNLSVVVYQLSFLLHKKAYKLWIT